MNNKFKSSSKQAQHGSVLLEALIAFLIFSMGILGVIGLQATSINNTLDARYRTDAAFLANQIIAQMWVDPVLITAATAAAPAIYGIPASYNCPAASPCTTTNGNANTQAWVQQIQGTANQPGFLPGVTDAANQPSIDIVQTANLATGQPTYQVTVTLNWQSPQSNSVSHNYVTKTQIQFN